MSPESHKAQYMGIPSPTALCILLMSDNDGKSSSGLQWKDNQNGLCHFGTETKHIPFNQILNENHSKHSLKEFSSFCTNFDSISACCCKRQSTKVNYRNQEYRFQTPPPKDKKAELV